MNRETEAGGGEGSVSHPAGDRRFASLAAVAPFRARTRHATTPLPTGDSGKDRRRAAREIRPSTHAVLESDGERARSGLRGRRPRVLAARARDVGVRLARLLVRAQRDKARRRGDARRRGRAHRHIERTLGAFLSLSFAVHKKSMSLLPLKYSLRFSVSWWPGSFSTACRTWGRRIGSARGRDISHKEGAVPRSDIGWCSRGRRLSRSRRLRAHGQARIDGDDREKTAGTHRRQGGVVLKVMRVDTPLENPSSSKGH